MPVIRILAALALIASTASATLFTLGGGMNFSTMNIEDNESPGDDVDYSLRPGFNVGMGLEFYLGPTSRCLRVCSSKPAGRERKPRVPIRPVFIGSEMEVVL